MVKKAFIFLSIFLFSNFIFSQCHYLIYMNDSYGDGWNSAYIEVNMNGNFIGNYDCSQSFTLDSVYSTSGASMEFIWHSGDYDNEITTKEKLLNFITIPKVIFFIIFLVLLDLYSNEARIINHLLDAYMCRGLEEGLPPVSSGCYDLTPRDN